MSKLPRIARGLSDLASEGTSMMMLAFDAQGKETDALYEALASKGLWRDTPLHNVRLPETTVMGNYTDAHGLPVAIAERLRGLIEMHTGKGTVTKLAFVLNGLWFAYEQGKGAELGPRSGDAATDQLLGNEELAFQ